MTKELLVSFKENLNGISSYFQLTPYRVLLNEKLPLENLN
jgi:hypothetical protein